MPDKPRGVCRLESIEGKGAAQESADEFWERVAPGLRQYMGLGPMTLEEAQAEFDAAEDEPLSDEQIESIVHYAKTGQMPDAGRGGAVMRTEAEVRADLEKVMLAKPFCERDSERMYRWRLVKCLVGWFLAETEGEYSPPSSAFENIEGVEEAWVGAGLYDRRQGEVDRRGEPKP